MRHQQINRSSTIEKLENRQLLSSVVLATDGTLTITGSSGPDAIEVQLRAKDNGKLKVEVGTMERKYTAASVKRIVVNALGGNDSVEIGKDDEPVRIQSVINGGSGNDNLDGGASGDTINGGDGNDNIDGEGGNDKLYGGNGADTLQGGSGKDQLFGEAGNDFLQGKTGNDTLVGGAGKDILEGNQGVDVVTQ